MNKHKVKVFGVKLTIRKSAILPPLGFAAINLYPFAIYTRRNADELSERLLRHEAIHTLQARGLLVVFHWLLYGLEFLIKFAIALNFKKAYYSVSFEQEAYYNADNLNYHNERRWFSFANYIFKLYKPC